MTTPTPKWDIRSYTLEETTPKLRSQLRSLTLRDKGAMSSTFSTAVRRKNTNVTILVAHQGGQVVGWSLVELWTPSTDNWDGYAYFYVRASCRRQGIAQALLGEALKIAPRLSLFGDMGRIYSNHYLTR